MFDLNYPGLPFASLDSEVFSSGSALSSVDADAGMGLPFGAIVICVLVGFALSYSADIVRSVLGFFRRAKDEVEAFNDGYLPRF